MKRVLEISDQGLIMKFAVVHNRQAETAKRLHTNSERPGLLQDVYGSPQS